jgi:hypothetical protein
MHETLSWEKLEDQVNAFRDDIVFSDIMSTEASTKSMLEWMSVLPMHRFMPRHFEEEGERSPLEQANLFLKKDRSPSVRRHNDPTVWKSLVVKTLCF